jgi:RNA polymerase sigma-70 factor (ECF subfamily)
MNRRAESLTHPVAAARAGDPDAWDALLRQHQLRLYAYARELLHDDQAALDAVQDTFVNAVRHLGSLRDDSRFTSWLFGILHQKCQAQGRQRGRERQWLAGSLDEETNEAHPHSPSPSVADPGPDPSDWLIHQEQEEQFFAVLQSLPAPQRSLLLLRFLDEFSLEEIAEITAVPLGTVKSRLHHARTAFRQLWTHSCHEDAP